MKKTIYLVILFFSISYLYSENDLGFEPIGNYDFDDISIPPFEKIDQLSIEIEEIPEYAGEMDYYSEDGLFYRIAINTVDNRYLVNIDNLITDYYKLDDNIILLRGDIKFIREKKMRYWPIWILNGENGTLYHLFNALGPIFIFDEYIFTMDLDKTRWVNLGDVVGEEFNIRSFCVYNIYDLSIIKKIDLLDELVYLIESSMDILFDDVSNTIRIEYWQQDSDKIWNSGTFLIYPEENFRVEKIDAVN